jgi:hypothetical protein
MLRYDPFERENVNKKDIMRDTVVTLKFLNKVALSKSAMNIIILGNANEQ